MAEINTKFIALPKTYKYPEDLEDGLYYTENDIAVIYDAPQAIFRVIEKEEDIDHYNNITVHTLRQKEAAFSLKDWIVIYDGRLYVDSKTDIQH